MFQAVLPEDCNIKNFTSDWNNGINLSALIDYCQPGLCPNWRNLDPRRGEENNRRAMEIGKNAITTPSFFCLVQKLSVRWRSKAYFV